MNRKTLFLPLLMLWCLLVSAGDWKPYLSYREMTQNLPIDGRIYALGSGALFTYAYGDSTVHTFSKSNGLSSTNITHMAYCEALKQLVLVYEDYNIDIVGTDKSVINIPQYKNSNYTDKKINDLAICDENAYIATNFGVVVINLKKAEFTNAYEIGFAVNSAIGDSDNIYAASKNGVYVGDISKNLLETSNWQKKNIAAFRYIRMYNNALYGMASNALYRFDSDTFTTTLVLRGNYTYISSYGKDLVFGNPTSLNIIDDKETLTTINYQNQFNYVTSDGTYLWASQGFGGLQPYTITQDSLGQTTLKAAYMAVIPNSPIRNYFSEMHFTPNNKLLVAGGALAYSGKTYYDGTIMALENGRWLNFSEDSIYIKTEVPYSNITTVAEDPNDPSHHFAASATGGLYEFRNGKFVQLYNCDNSPISTIYPNNPLYKNYNRITGVTYDPNGNMWMFNNLVDTIVRVVTPKNEWKSFYFKEIAKHPTFDNYLFDSRGWVWISHRRWAGTYLAGIACLNYNGTLDNKDDDSFTFCTTFIDQRNTPITISLLYSIIFDRNEQLWIGTDQGVLILEDPKTIFNSTQKFHRPLIPRNDGTNYADYLLEGVPVKCIAVDGANRKWLGTTNNGLYLVSQDGLEIIQHFTADNSPLLSDCILSLAINQSTGEVMIGTDKGLVSYRGDATEPATELKENNIKVFPNPIHPTYNGKIRISGFTVDTDVKITTNTGLLIAQGTSLGGTFVWDGLDKAGNRVGTGVYFVVASDAKDSTGVVAKLVVIK